MKIELKATTTLRYEPTGRESTGDEEYKLFQSWYQGDEKRLFTDIYFTTKILPQLKDAKLLNGVFDYYRGVSSDVILDIPRMGPCPKDKFRPSEENRYNFDFVAFYLAETELGVVKELGPLDGKVCILKYTMNFDELHVADLADYDLKLANELMFHCELSGEEGYRAKTFSQHIGKYLSSLFDGVVVRGVRGDKNYHYKNLVWFNKLDHFKKYINGKPHIYS